jgi:hypothetical protein
MMHKMFLLPIVRHADSMTLFWTESPIPELIVGEHADRVENICRQMIKTPAE